MISDTAWIVFAINMNPKNSVKLDAQGAIITGTMEAASETELFDCTYSWVNTIDGEIVQVLDWDISEPPLDIIVSHMEDTDFSTAEGSSVPLRFSYGKCTFEVVWISRKPFHLVHKKISFVDTVSDALSFFMQYQLKPRLLSPRLSQQFRQRWREGFLTPSMRNWHRCDGCGRRRKPVAEQRFDWEGLYDNPLIKVSEVLPAITDLAPPKSLIGVFFERCDLPVFILQSERMYLFDPKDFIDLYIAPISLPRLRIPKWTVVFTHEPECGSYFAQR